MPHTPEHPEVAVSDKNFLKIKAQSLDLELKGEPEYVELAYRALRDVLMERFKESLEVRGEETLERGTEDLPVVTPQQARERLNRPGHAHLVLCNDVYHKVFLIEGPSDVKGALGKVLKLEHIGRIYINRSQQDSFMSTFGFGRVLWRELTAAGRDAVRKGR